MILSQKLIISPLFIILSGLNIASATDKNVTSKITVSKLHSEGDVYVQVVELDKKNQWQHYEQMFKINNSKIAHTTEFKLELTSNKHYGMRIFQDINKNQQLDMTDTGIPLEPVGFSQNPSLVNGIPPLSDCQFTAGESIEINMKWRKKK